ncbi:MAG: dihydropteroate synthase [Spirochaetes bacterium]|nr:dihydropteroate synthase [Spirochaetota bacterium]
MVFYDFSPIDFLDVDSEFSLINVSKEAFNLMKNKNRFVRFYIKNLEFREANILKQEALSRKLEFAISYKTYMMDPKEKRTDGMLSGNLYHLFELIEKLKIQPFSLGVLAKELEEYINFNYLKNFTPEIKIGNRNFKWRDNCYIVGILNVTPDSFYEGSRVNIDNVLQRAKFMADNGVDIFDVGGESTRPGSESISVDEELSRVIPVIELLKKNFDIPISIDTTKAKVAELSFEAGADMLNDISACQFDPEMINVVSKYNKPVCVMHIKGRPKDMQKNPQYNNVIDEIYEYFINRVNFLIERGIKRDNIIIDPGIGFGKNIEHNFILTKYLKAFKTLKLPILYGGSRKSFIGLSLKREPESRLPASLVVHTLAFLNGASFLRVHDVMEQSDAIKIVQMINSQNRNINVQCI